MSLVWRVVRIQFVNWLMALGFPVLILALAFLGNVGVFAVISDVAPPEGRITGGMVSIYLTLLIAHLQTMTQFFPFALGLSVTRRVFFAATSMFILGQALLYSVLLYGMRLIEEATNGWGLHVRFFGLPFMETSNPVLQLLVYLVPFLFLSFLGVYTGIVLKRWGAFGVWTLWIGIAAAAIALAVLATWRGWWPAVGRFFTEQSAFSLFAGYPFILAVLLAGLGYLTLRRATA
ncbi:hypothetical protein [Prauserella muralis]|uniref:Uncharacterized protein n=1 Tax=Prauserella muralis TaxID=588067 RepID=A0A2V4B1A5_9PSEU|nr:hypothetical protein [Prauserella muralis]PXY27936.1 hypothetical protein BAY60_16425 [Prauserella muralis]TWE22280.1 hypothetical protein FHX69_3516 [Prauserella muralis]